MSFRCQLCGLAHPRRVSVWTPTAENVNQTVEEITSHRPVKVVTEERRVVYVLPSGKEIPGKEIVREINVCSTCVQVGA